MRQLLLCGVIAIALGLPSLVAAQATPSAAEYLPRPAPPTPSRDSVRQAGGDEGGQPVTRHFAQRMVLDHAACEGTIAAAAYQSGVRVDAPRPTPAQEAMLLQLAGQSGPSFDRLYLDQQLETHRKALALQTSYSSGGDDPGLYPASRIPTMVRMHLGMLASIQTSPR